MDKNTIISSAEMQLKSFGNFLTENDTKLMRLLNSTIESENTNSIHCCKRPIKIQYTTSFENLSMLKLIDSDNKLLNKTILTFAYLCEEANFLKRESRKMQLKFLYLDEELCTFDYENNNQNPNANTSGEKTTEKCLIKISDSMAFLCELQALAHRCIVVASNILHQCGAFLSETQLQFQLHLSEILDSLANVAIQLVIFDEILYNSNFNKYWTSYMKSMQSVSHNLDKFSYCGEAEINGIINVINELEILFSGNLFQSFLHSTFHLKEKIPSKAIGLLSLKFNEVIKINLASIEKITELSECNETELLIKINTMCVLFHNFFGHIDQKCFKNLLEFNLKYMGITLIGNVIWLPECFLVKHADTLMKPFEKYSSDSSKLRQNYLQNRAQCLQRDCKNYCVQITLWTIHFEQFLKTDAANLKVDQFKHLCSLFLQGLQYAGQLSYKIKSLTNLHMVLHTTMNKSTLLCICKLIEYLKMIQLVFQKEVENIPKVVQCILQYLQYRALQMIHIAKKKIINETLNDKNVDTLSALKIAEKCLYGPVTRARILVINLTVNSNSNFGHEQYDKFKKLLNKMQVLINFQDSMEELCNSSFSYWHQSLLAVYLRQIVEKKTDYHSFQYMLSSSNECTNTLERLNLGGLTINDILKRSNFNDFKSEIVNKLCSQIENFLRLEVHSNLQLEKINPFEKGINDYRDLINVGPIILNGYHIILKGHIENYLSTMFYNLTTISLHDWKTYEEMRQYANYKLNLNPINDYLPTQTLEQGIDVLEIMRNIHIFVSKYLYNMNTQIFIEQSSPNKHLNTIGIRHIANSLRTHGNGIINTTVNFTYQFLRQKFYTFSQFLYDEQIKSRLMKELRYFVDNKKVNNYMYAYERADNFNKDIKKLGLSQDGQTYMDLFRKVITNIGNAMGYIRLIRSGCIHANYSASLYLPKFDENLKFYETVKNDNLSEVTQKAAEIFEMNIKNLSNSFSDGTDYFRLLVDAFRPFFNNPNNFHLKTFYLIIPSLTLNYIEYILGVKDKIHKKDKQDAVLFDDGFSMGIAYILKLLDQFNDFNSLHWFASIQQRFKEEQEKILKITYENPLNFNKMDEKLKQTVALTEKRISAHQKEFNLLYFNICSAKILFQ